MRVVFFHVGADISVPHMMVSSVRAVDPQAVVIQCSDTDTPQVPGTNEVFRLPVNRGCLMEGRLRAFMDLGLTEPAAYVDTDLIWRAKIDVAASLRQKEAIFCERSFGRDSPFNHQYLGMDFSEHAGKTLGDVYPYLACFTLTSGYQTWGHLHNRLMSLDPKYLEWYGDQEAMRVLMHQDKNRFGFVAEALVACLPEMFDSRYPPFALHFKGRKRKPLMRALAEKLGVI